MSRQPDPYPRANPLLPSGGSSRGTTSPLCRRMGSTHQRPSGAIHRTSRIHNRVGGRAAALPPSYFYVSPSGFVQEDCALGRDLCLGGEGCRHPYTNSRYFSRFLLPHFSCGEKDRGMASNPQPQQVKFLCEKTELPDGDPPVRSESSLSRGLVGYARSEGCIFSPIPIHRSSCRYLRFAIEGRVYQFVALPFGLTSAPRNFTRVCSVVVSLCHLRSVHVHPYIDDWLIRSPNRVQASSDTCYTVRILSQLGFILNQSKSILIPSQQSIYLGMSFDTASGLVQPSEKRFSGLTQVINRFLSLSCVTAREFLRLLGILTSLGDIVPMGVLHRRQIQWHLRASWNMATKSLSHLIPLPSSIKRHLRWWLDPTNVLKGVPLHTPLPQRVLFSDASNFGWGAHLDDRHLAGLWTNHQRSHHINWLELKAVWLGLVGCQDLIQNQPVLVRTDNSAVVSYINHQGGTRSLDMCSLTLEMFRWCAQRSISLSAHHLAGRLNVLADALSRNRWIDPREWSLHRSVAKQLFNRWGSPQVDLFATSLNSQLPLFMSLHLVPKSLATDALSVPWSHLDAYAFPPTGILPVVLGKILREDCLVTLVAPFWPKRSWFPLLLDLSIDYPIRLPGMPDLLVQGDLVHPDPSIFHFHAWRLSSNLIARRGFLDRLPPILPPRKEAAPLPFTMPDGRSIAIGVSKGRYILSLPL